MYIVVGFYVFILGLAFGSFALAMVDRMKVGKDWVKARSACDFCGHTLAASDLVPVFSWAFFGGKCHYCRNKLSVMYPLAELGMGLAFLASYIFYPYELHSYGLSLLVIWLFNLILLGALFIYDLRWFLLPNKLVYPLIVTATVHRIVFIVGSEDSIAKLAASLAGSLLVGAGLFFVLHAVSSGKWIGDGDVRLAFAIGLLLPGPLEVWITIFSASVLGLLVATPQISKQKKGLKTVIPFGPMLIVGLFIAYLFGAQLIDWYGSTFLSL